MSQCNFVSMLIFTARSVRMADGKLLGRMAGAGSRHEWTVNGDPIAMVIGSGQREVGTGSAMSHGRGRLIITDVGIGDRRLAGIGCRRHNGLQRGLPGIRSL